MIKISIIIPAKNEEKSLAFLLKDIKQQNWEKFEKEFFYEVIVADANSTDKTREVANRFGVKIVDGGLPSIGRNRGAKESCGDILFMLDADVRIKNKNFFYLAYREFIERKLDCAVVDTKPIIPRNLSKPRADSIRFVYNFMNFFIHNVQYSKNPRAQGAGMIFKRSVFFKVGGFDEDIYFCEDGEIAKKIVKKKCKFAVLNPEISIEISIRKILKYGIIRSSVNTLFLEIYRSFNGKIHSREDYYKLFNIPDYFSK